MNKFLSATVIAGCMCIATGAHAACDGVKDAIAQKIISNGVPETAFTLEFVAPEDLASASGKVVGQCGGKKIVYTRLNGETKASGTKAVSTTRQTTTKSEPNPKPETKPKANDKATQVSESAEAKAVDPRELNLGADESIVNQSELDEFKSAPQAQTEVVKTSSTESNPKPNDGVVIYR